ncbi:PAAR domain-containing protein [Paraburkholderia sp. CNPSo 3157]|uniref:PAAR domain-containing protein n=1 Tax=Paraburkholderia franconis TaxID=2654983 RepID=A0A7X1N879_9BURK|nr:PAAR domain-containing protein [Paraburkholderia franconis]MPW17182.1 PAAR domain-containing protein [Paraburkholderia franconis]
MRDIAGREVARLGHVTDHGGRIIEGAGDFSQKGIPVALDGHQVECPKCGGSYPIIATGRMTHKGRRVAYVGDATACGAILMRG